MSVLACADAVGVNSLSFDDFPLNPFDPYPFDGDLYLDDFPLSPFDDFPFPDFPDFSRRFLGNLREISGNVQDISRKFPGHFPEFSRNCSGKLS